MDIRCLVAVGAVIVQGLIVDDVGEVEDMVVGVHEESQKRRLRKRTAQGFSWTRTASRPRSTSRRAATTATLFYSSLSALCCHHLVCPRNHCLTRLTLSLAVAARFGIGKDFWINVLLTLCGYIPGMFILIHFTLSHRSTQGHGHNFYVQVRSLFPLLPLPSVTTGLVTEYP